MRNRKKKCKGKHEIEVMTSELGEKTGRWRAQCIFLGEND